MQRNQTLDDFLLLSIYNKTYKLFLSDIWDDG